MPVSSRLDSVGGHRWRHRSGTADESRDHRDARDREDDAGRGAVRAPARPRDSGRAVLPAGGRGVRVRVPAIARGLPGTPGTLGAEPEFAATAARGYLRPDTAGLPRLYGRDRGGPR